MSDGSAYAAAELGTALRDGEADSVRRFAGLIDDDRGRALLNYYDSLFLEPVEETSIGQEIIANYSTDTIDNAVKNGAVSQMKAATGLTGQSEDGRDFYGAVASQLEYEGSIGLVFGSPGSGKTATTIDAAKVWQARTGGAIIGNTTWDGFDGQFSSDKELLEEMASRKGPVLAVIDEVAQDLSGFGSGNKDAEHFSDNLLLIRNRDREYGDYAKKGSVLLVGHTRVKTAKSIRRIASFGIEKPKRSAPDRARLLESEGGKDQWEEVDSYQGLTDSAANYAEYESSTFTIELADEDDEDDGEDTHKDEQWRKDVETVIRATQVRDMTQKEAMDLVDWSKGWVANRVQEWKDGEHEFVTLPEQ